MTDQKEQEQQEEKPREIRGTARSLMLGGFCAFGVFILAIGLGWAFIFSGIRHVDKLLESEPVSIEYNVNKADLAGVYAKLEKYFVEVDLKRSTKVEASFSAQDLNTLICHDEHFSYLKGHFRVAIKEGELSCATSLPFDWVTYYKDEEPRYLNGKTYYNFEMHRGTDFFLRFLAFEQNGVKSKLDFFAVIGENNLLGYWLPTLEEEERALIDEKLKLVIDVKVIEDQVVLRNWHYDENSGKTIYYHPEGRR